MGPSAVRSVGVIVVAGWRVGEDGGGLVFFGDLGCGRGGACIVGRCFGTGIGLVRDHCFGGGLVGSG